MLNFLRRIMAWLDTTLRHASQAQQPAVEEITPAADDARLEISELLIFDGLRERAIQLAERDDPQMVAKLTEASGDWRLEFDSPYNRGYDYERLGILGQYTLLREWNIYERQAILERCHMAHERNPLANTAVGLTTLFVVGKGLNVTYQNPDVQAVLEDFIGEKENAFEAAQKELCNQLQVDGEVFIRFYTEGGRTLVASIQPWYIKWIEADPNFRKRVLNYRMEGTFTNGAFAPQYTSEDIDPRDILHVKINAFNYELRGRPDLFRNLPWLKAYKDWLEERARINRRQGSMYFDMTLKNATPAQVNAQRAAYRTPPPPASLFVHNDNVVLGAIGGQVRASDAAQDGREMKMMFLAGMNMPEYMFGEGRNATKATSSNQELPALAKFEDFQTTLVDTLWKPMLKRVIQNAIDAGILPDVVPAYNHDGSEAMDKGTGQGKLIRAVDAFDCDFPDLRTPDPLTLAQAIQIMLASGLISQETATMVMGYDYEAEQDKIEREKQQSMAQAYAGGTTPPIPASGAPIPASGPPVPAQEAESFSVSEVPAQVQENDAMKPSDVVAIIEALKPLTQPQPPPPPAQNFNFGRLVMEGITAEDIRPVVHVAVPEQQAPQVVVNVPEAQPHPAPIVNVTVPEQAAPIVNVAAPAVTVNPPPIQVVENAPRTTNFELVKDQEGNTIGIKKTEA